MCVCREYNAERPIVVVYTYIYIHETQIMHKTQIIHASSCPKQ